MTDLNKLATVQESDLSGSDLFHMWSQRFGCDVAASLTIISEYIAATVSPSALSPQLSAPQATGFTVEVTDGNTWLVLTPGATYATGTIVLPLAADGEEVLVNCTQVVTALTITPQTGDSTAGAPTSLASDDFFRLKYEGSLKRWYRVG